MDLNHLKFFLQKNLLTNLLIAEIVFNLINFIIITLSHSPSNTNVEVVIIAALAQEGVEPSSLDNDSKMLPLHYRAINNALYSGEAQSPTPYVYFVMSS